MITIIIISVVSMLLVRYIVLYGMLTVVRTNYPEVINSGCDIYKYPHTRIYEFILRHSKRLNLLRRYRVLKMRERQSKTLQNRLKPMDVTQVIGYIPENRTTIEEFMYELQGLRVLPTKEK